MMMMILRTRPVTHNQTQCNLGMKTVLNLLIFQTEANYRPKFSRRAHGCTATSIQTRLRG
ncbi:hypothetical protein AHF37_11014 [Paragonimus kellicotti]|nr:hypothetical protein AHF37_11014 [Paragonimus kellicotti]